MNEYVVALLIALALVALSVFAVFMLPEINTVAERPSYLP